MSRFARLVGHDLRKLRMSHILAASTTGCVYAFPNFRRLSSAALLFSEYPDTLMPVLRQVPETDPIVSPVILL